jgi:hypothetical protein
MMQHAASGAFEAAQRQIVYIVAYYAKKQPETP